MSKGFTLIELVVVIAILLLLMGVAVPSISRLFSAGSEATAENVLHAQIATARGEAITSGRPTGVLLQRHGDRMVGVLVQVVTRGDTGPLLGGVEGAVPRSYPVGVGLGPIMAPGHGDVRGTEGFESFTVLWGPDGRQLPGLSYSRLEPQANDEMHHVGEISLRWHPTDRLFSPPSGLSLPPQQAAAWAVVVFSQTHLEQTFDDKGRWTDASDEYFQAQRTLFWNMFTGEPLDYGR